MKRNLHENSILVEIFASVVRKGKKFLNFLDRHTKVVLLRFSARTGDGEREITRLADFSFA